MKIESKILAMISEIDTTTTPKRYIPTGHGRRRGVGSVEEQRRSLRGSKPIKSDDELRELEIEVLDRLDPDDSFDKLPIAEGYKAEEPLDYLDNLPPTETRTLGAVDSTTRTPIDPSRALPVGRHQRIRDIHNSSERRKALRRDTPIISVPDWAK